VRTARFRWRRADLRPRGESGDSRQIVQSAVGTHPAGDPVKLVVDRNNMHLALTARLSAAGCGHDGSARRRSEQRSDRVPHGFDHGAFGGSRSLSGRTTGFGGAYRAGHRRVYSPIVSAQCRVAEMGHVGRRETEERSVSATETSVYSHSALSHGKTTAATDFST